MRRLGRGLLCASALITGVALAGCGGGAARVIGSGARSTTTAPLATTSLPSTTAPPTTVPVATTTPTAPPATAGTPVGPALTAQITSELNSLTASLAQAQSDLATSSKTGTGG